MNMYRGYDYQYVPGDHSAGWYWKQADGTEHGPFASEDACLADIDQHKCSSV